MSTKDNSTTVEQSDKIPPQIVEFVEEHTSEVSNVGYLEDNTRSGYAVKIDAKRINFNYLPDGFRVTAASVSPAWDGVRAYIREE